MAAAETIVEPGMGTLEVFALDTSEDTLFAFLRDVFDRVENERILGYRLSPEKPLHLSV